MFFTRKQQGARTLLPVLLLVKKNYSTRTNTCVNAFNPYLKLPDHAEISEATAGANFAVKKFRRQGALSCKTILRQRPSGNGATPSARPWR
jgi:hypothetical protein